MKKQEIDFKIKNQFTNFPERELLLFFILYFLKNIVLLSISVILYESSFDA